LALPISRPPIPLGVPLARAVEARGFDSLSEGRFLFSIGAGWNAEELKNHGLAFADRWKVLAMKACWPN
jgi:alkanesulfonate monooxygenase SsuD/methylene tetrahydromethanopterin reductase-like flavin-dependent oxidoreductase (luciferase family)